MFFKKIQNKLLFIFVLVIIVMLGLVQSSTIFGGDQSLFIVIAQLIDSGKIIYKDLFDYKQPGIYLFYLIAGKSFGWNETGIHLFELGYWILFSIITVYLLNKKSLFQLPYINSLLPLFFAGIYYSNAYILHLTQLEALVTFPIFLIVWLLDKAFTSEKKLFITYLVIGILTGIVLLCKLVYGPIILMFFLIHFIFILKSKKLKYIISKQIFPITVGVIIPASIFLSYVFINHIGDLVFTIYFKIPTDVISLADQVDPKRLFSSILWFTNKMAVFILLAVIGTFLFPKKESHFFSLLFSWIIIGFLVILMQKTSWWEYHFQLLYFPIGILSAIGIDFILHNFLSRINIKSPIKRFFIIVVVLCFVFFNQLSTVFPNTYLKNSPSYKDYTKNEIAQIAGVIKKENTIFICGNPRLYLLTSHLPEISVNGWILEYYLDRQWDDFFSQFKNRPPAYLYISTGYFTLIQQKSPSLWETITNYYSEFTNSELGIWYKQK